DQTPPVPEPPKPVVTPPPSVKPEPIKPPEEVKPVDKPEIQIPKPTKPKIKVDLTPVVRDQKKVADDAAAEKARADREAKRLQDQKLKAIQASVRSIKAGATAATVVDTSPGTASVSYANYASVVKSIYEAAWTPPDDASSDDANVKVSVTISNDGRVLDAHVIDASGDAQVDGSVRRTLDKVNFIAPFPEGAKEKERTFKINFNLKAKRMFG
ncbi:MAG: TonB family protein, partial [Verrucomicrobia bacterium]|nr:TonB family protein [Verrucomicrobiota bacterium]